MRFSAHSSQFDLCLFVGEMKYKLIGKMHLHKNMDQNTPRGLHEDYLTLQLIERANVSEHQRMFLQLNESMS